MLENVEIWKDCKGYEGRYQVSNLGRVWSIIRQRNLKIQNDTHNYQYVRLTAKNGKMKTEMVHRLVALAFIPNPEGLPQVNHKDEDKQNNNVSNLEWVSAKENCNYGTRNKRILEKKSKAVKCIETGVVYPSIAEASRVLNLSQGNICWVCQGKLHKTGGYHWEYVDNSFHLGGD